LWGVTPDGIVLWEDAWKTGTRRPQLVRSGANWRWVSYVSQPRILGIASETNVDVIALPELNTIFSTNVNAAKAWAISPNGAWLAVAIGLYQDVHDDQLLIFDLHQRRQAASLKLNTSSLTFDPTCRWLATGSADACRLLELGTWREVRRFNRKAANGRVSPMAFTRDGRWFAYAHSPAVIELAEAATGRSLASLEAPDRLQLRGLAFGPTGDTLAAAVENGVVQLWNLAELRRELGRLRLDWPDENPSGSTSP
jgi:WD40 repeat protein